MSDIAPPMPTSQDCDEFRVLERTDAQVLYACWYPQMGGSAGRCVVRVDLMDKHACFDAWVWHDGEFPLGEGEDPKYLHHCDPAQFIGFAQEVSRKRAGA